MASLGLEQEGSIFFFTITPLATTTTCYYYYYNYYTTYFTSVSASLKYKNDGFYSSISGGKWVLIKTL